RRRSARSWPEAPRASTACRNDAAFSSNSGARCARTAGTPRPSTMLFALKLTLVPLFIAGVTLGSRRWGPRIGGWLNAVPMVAGPVFVVPGDRAGRCLRVARRAQHARRAHRCGHILPRLCLGG